jgi:Na+/proline symporter
MSRIELYYFFGVYVILLLAIALKIFIANINENKNDGKNNDNDDKNELKNHFLGGKNTNSFVLFLTTFSTMFSGYIMVGVPQEVNEIGFVAFRWLGIIISTAISVAIVVPRLRTLSIQRNYSSPIDFISDRYKSEHLRSIILALLIFSGMIYMTGQFASIYGVIETITEGEIDGLVGCIFFGLLMFILEIIGGLKSVMLTDSIQSIIMIGCFIIIPIVLASQFGSYSSLLEANDCNDTLDNKCGLLEQGSIFEHYPDKKILLSVSGGIFGFISNAIQPQYVHRIYTSNSALSLKKTLFLLPFTPYFTAIPTIFIGLVYSARLNSNTGTPFAVVAGYLYNLGSWNRFISCLMMCSSVAAICSTADSVLIAISHLLSEDIFKNKFKNNATQKEVLYCSKISSLFIITTCICLLLIPNFSINDCVSFQIAFQIQAFPVFFIGLFPEIANISSRSFIYGISCAFICIIIIEFVIRTYSANSFLDSGIWGFFIQIIVISLCEKYFDKEYLNDDKRNYDLPLDETMERFNSNMGSNNINRLSSFDIEKVQELNINEPFGSLRNKIIIIICLLTLIIVLPWYHDTNSTFTFVNGLPFWLIFYISIASLISITVSYLVYQWQVPDELLLINNTPKKDSDSNDGLLSNSNKNEKNPMQRDESKFSDSTDSGSSRHSIIELKSVL